MRSKRASWDTAMVILDTAGLVLCISLLHARGRREVRRVNPPRQERQEGSGNLYFTRSPEGRRIQTLRAFRLAHLEASRLRGL